MKSLPLTYTAKHTSVVSSMLAVVLIVSALVSLSGCAHTDNATPEESNDSYTLVESGTLTVAASLDFPPFETLTNGKPSGFAVELMELLADKMGLTCTYLPSVKFDSIVPMIAAGGKADVGVSSFTISAERAREIDFTDPYMDANQGVVVTTDSKIVDPTELKGKTIGAQSGTTGYDWAVENIEDAHVVAYDEMTAIFAALQSGNIEGIVADLPVVLNYTANAYQNCSVIAQIPTGEQYAIVVNKSNPALTQALNDALAQAMADGTYDALYNKYFS